MYHVLIADVSSTIEVSIKLITTLSTTERPLRLAVALGRVITAAARLAGVTRVNRHHSLPTRLTLVVEETSQLGKAPTVQAAGLLPMPLLHSGTDVRQLVVNPSQGSAEQYAFDCTWQW